MQVSSTLSSSSSSALPDALKPLETMATNSMIWFRKGLRIHDNPALEHACKCAKHLYPVFVLDPHYLKPDPTAFSPGSDRAGLNRIQFFLESLDDLDSSLRKLGSRLLLFRGSPVEVLIRLLKEWDVKKLCFEYDTEPYYQALDKQIKDYASSAGIEVFCPVSHTLFSPEDIIQKNAGRPPLSYQSFVKLAGNPPSPLATTISSLPPVRLAGSYEILRVLWIKELGYGDISQEITSGFDCCPTCLQLFIY